MQQADSVVDHTRAIVEAQANSLPTRRSANPRQIDELVVRGEQFQVRRSCRQNFIEVMKVLIDIVQIRNCARHFHPQRFAITLTQTPKPGTQRRYGDSSGDLRNRFALANCHRAAVVVSSSKCSLG